jgi:hypothetical protein
MRRYVYIAFIVGLAMLVTGLALRADIAMPRDKWSQVRMVSEHVKITLSPASVAVEATFDLKNEKEAATVVVGYPRGILEKSLDDFKVTVDGEAVAVASQPGEGDVRVPKAPGRGGEQGGAVKSGYQFAGPYPEWKTFSVKFDAAQTRKVVVSYRVAPAEVQGSDKGKLLAYIYTMKTGASWLGKIDKAVVECRLEGISMKDIVSVTPKPASKTDAAAAPLVWVFENFKPTQDIEITFKAK